jgi:hypothetical protein
MACAARRGRACRVEKSWWRKGTRTARTQAHTHTHTQRRDCHCASLRLIEAHLLVGLRHVARCGTDKSMKMKRRGMTGIETRHTQQHSTGRWHQRRGCHQEGWLRDTNGSQGSRCTLTVACAHACGRDTSLVRVPSTPVETHAMCMRATTLLTTFRTCRSSAAMWSWPARAAAAAACSSTAAND